MIKFLFNDGFIVPIALGLLIIIKLVKEFVNPNKNNALVIMLVCILVFLGLFTSLLIGWRSYSF